MSFPSDNSSGQPNARFQWFENERTEILEAIGDGTLAGLGAVTATTGMRTPIITGISLSRKAVADTDTDRTQHHVKRDQFGSPGIVNPGQSAIDVSS